MSAAPNRSTAARRQGASGSGSANGAGEVNAGQAGAGATTQPDVSQGSGGAGASGSGAGGARTGTPVDAPAVRRDFSASADAASVASVASVASEGEDQARSYAIAAQAQERRLGLVQELARPAPKPLVALPPDPDANLAAGGGTAATGYADATKALRGDAEPARPALSRAA